MTEERARKLLHGTFAALCLASLAPFWLVRYPPLLDWPNHLAAASAWAHYHVPAWHFARYYELRLGRCPIGPTMRWSARSRRCAGCSSPIG